MTLNKSYSELITLTTFKERFEYLKLNGAVGKDTFGHQRYLNQDFYSSAPWRSLRNKLIIRDGGFDMAFEGMPCVKIVIHHINPITVEDFENNNPIVWDPENLVCVDFNTHNAIHYGDFNLIKQISVIERRPNDTSPWKL